MHRLFSRPLERADFFVEDCFRFPAPQPTDATGREVGRVSVERQNSLQLGPDGDVANDLFDKVECFND